MLLVVLDKKGNPIGQANLNGMAFKLQDNVLYNMLPITVVTSNSGYPCKMVFGDDDGNVLDISNTLDLQTPYSPKGQLITFMPGKLTFIINKNKKQELIPLPKGLLPRWLRIK